MKDKKFIIAVSIVVILLLTIIILTVIVPKTKQYITDKQVEGFNIAINNIVQTVNAQGMTQIQNGENNVIVCQNVEVPEQVAGS